MNNGPMMGSPSRIKRETPMEHIARDIREGNFPKKSEPMPSDPIGPAIGSRARDSRAKVVEEGLAHFHELQEERDKLKKQCEASDLEIARLEGEIENFHNKVAGLESERTTAMAEKDKAVSEAAAYATLLASIMAMCRAFKLPSVPLIKDVLAPPEDE